jgi:mRNA-degrading endonuclease RelE of RelBE toxin-antitoxin system
VTKVRISAQVEDFVRRLPPEPRTRLRQALKAVARGKGDIKPLEGPLDDYCRLRVNRYRVIFAYGPGGVVQCAFAERRSIVYEVFAVALREALTRKAKK